MVEEKSKWIEAIAKIIKLTQKGRLKWVSISPNRLRERYPSDEISMAFVTTYKDKTLQIYEGHHWGLPPFSEVAAIFSKSKTPQKKLITSIVLEIVDAETFEPLWTFPKEEILKDLLSAIKYQLSGVGDFIDDILSED